MTAPSMSDLADFGRLVAEAFANLDAYNERTHADDADILMHHIAMGYPLDDMEPAIRAYAWRYCAIRRGAISGNGSPKKHAMRDVVIRALVQAARETGIDEGWSCVVAKHAGVSPSRVRQIAGETR